MEDAAQVTSTRGLGYMSELGIDVAKHMTKARSVRMRVFALYFALFFTLVCGVNAFAAGTQPPADPTRCERLLSKMSNWFADKNESLAFNSHTMALSFMVFDTLDTVWATLASLWPSRSGSPEEYNKAALYAYLGVQARQQAEKQWSHFKELEYMRLETAKPVLDNVIPNWESNPEIKIMLVYHADISLFTSAKERQPKDFKFGDVLIIKNGLVAGAIKYPTTDPSNYINYESN
jgi:hypothetical protein